jgi:hypothetical protein
MLGMQVGDHRDSHEGASPSCWMNLRFDHNLHCTSAHFAGRNQLFILQEGISYAAEPRPNQSGSRNGPGKGLSRLREVALDVAYASKAPSLMLGSDGPISPCGAMDTCHPDIRRACK